MKTITLESFLQGEPLSYQGVRRKMIAVYRAGVGVLLETANGKDLGVSTYAVTDRLARNLYHNLTRQPTPEQVNARVVGKSRRRK